MRTKFVHSFVSLCLLCGCGANESSPSSAEEALEQTEALRIIKHHVQKTVAAEVPSGPSARPHRVGEAPVVAGECAIDVTYHSIQGSAVDDAVNRVLAPSEANITRCDEPGAVEQSSDVVFRMPELLVVREVRTLDLTLEADESGHRTSRVTRQSFHRNVSLRTGAELALGDIVVPSSFGALASALRAKASLRPAGRTRTRLEEAYRGDLQALGIELSASGLRFFVDDESDMLSFAALMPWLSPTSPARSLWQ